MKVIPNDLIKSLSGKYCQHSNTYIALNSSSGLMHTGVICHPYTGPATAAQIAQQNSFKALANMVTAWLNANKPSANSILGTDDYRKAQSLKKELGLSNVRQVVYKFIDRQTGEVRFPDGTTSEAANGSSSTPSGNTGGDAGGGGF